MDFSLVSSAETASEISQSALQKVEGIGGGFYKSDGELLLGYTPAANRGTENMPVLGEGAAREDVQPAILEAARNAANSHMPAETGFDGRQ